MSLGIWGIMQRGRGAARILDGRRALGALVLAIAAAAIGLLTAPSKATAMFPGYMCLGDGSGCTIGHGTTCQWHCDQKGCKCKSGGRRDEE